MRWMFLAILLLAPTAHAIDFARETIPGKWTARFLPEDLPKLEYPKYYNDLDKARSQAFHGRYRLALLTLYRAKGEPEEIALIRADCLHALGRHGEAIHELTAPPIINRPRVQVLRGRILADTGRADEAIKLLTTHLNDNPASLAGHFYLARIYEQVGNLDAARNLYRWFIDDQKFLDKWLAKDPQAFENAETVTLIGRALDRWAVLTGAYQDNVRLHNTILSFFVKSYDEIDRAYWPAHVAAAEYALSHDDQPMAKKELKAALDANPNDLAAHELLAQLALSTFNFDAVDEIIADIRSVDPDSPCADLIAARNLLRQRRPLEAQAPINKVLKDQPRNLEALGLLAASYALQLQDDKTADILKRVDALDPDNATAPNEVAEQLGAMRQYPRSAAMYALAIDRAPWWTEPRNGLGLLYTQSGDEDLARATLEAARQIDPFNLRTTNYLRLLDDLARFARSETEHFVVLYDASADPVIPEYFGRYLESIYKDVCTAYNHEPAVKTFVEVFPTHDAFSVRTTGSPWIGTVGASTGRVIALCAPRKGVATMGPFNWAQVLRHEFTHTVTLSATDNRIAHWMTEGLAVWQERSPIRWEWVPMLYSAVKKKELFTLPDLTWAFIRPRRPIDRQLAYAQSYWLCSYIHDTYGHEAILKLLAAFKSGQSEADAIQHVLNKPIDQFQSDFFAWADKQVSSWGYDDKTTKQVEELQKKAEAALAAEHYDEATKLWEQIARLRPMDQLPHMRLAALYLRAKRTDDAIKHLAALHAVELHDSRYAKRIARIYRDDNRLAPAIKYALAAVYIDPYDADAHELLAELYERAGDAPAASREKRVLELLASLKNRRPHE